MDQQLKEQMKQQRTTIHEMANDLTVVHGTLKKMQKKAQNLGDKEELEFLDESLRRSEGLTKNLRELQHFFRSHT